MHAINVEDDYSLSWTETPDPKLQPDGVIIDVRASAVNRADMLQRRGKYPVPASASPILGLEAAGIISEVGSSVNGWSVGDRVCALLSGGGYAERAAVPADHLLRVPNGMTFEQAAAIPEVFLTAYLNIYVEAATRAGELIMVHAAASGVGTAALQLAQLLDNPVIGTASGSKLSELERWNPARLVDRREESFADVVRDMTQGNGVDVILDPVGADYLDDNLRSLARCGRLVSIGLLSGSSAQLDLGRILRNRLKVIGSVLRPRSDAEKTYIIERFRNDIWPHFRTGELAPVIHEVFPMQEAEKAHDLLVTNETIGKLVLSRGLSVDA